LDSGTKAGTPIHMPQPQLVPIDAAQWREQYETVALDTIRAGRKVLTAAVGAGDTIPQTLQRVAAVLGVNKRQPRGMWFKTQLVTRFAVMQVSNQGAMDAYKAQVGFLQEATPPFTSVIKGVEWLSSRDSRVCSYCQAMDGFVWPVEVLVSLQSVGFPPEASHGGCRCTVMVLVHEDFSSPENQPPDMTFAEWLLKNGFELFPDFVDDTVLDSTQV
jgi:hypothetical protein